jgi:hypothetical protein
MCYNSANELGNILCSLIAQPEKSREFPTGMRQFERFSYREPISYRIPNGHGWDNGLLVTFGGVLGHDISEGGLRFRTQTFVPSGTRMQLTFTVPSGKALTIEGQVVWVQKVPHSESYQMGFAFDRSGDNMVSREAIKEAFVLEI